MGRLITGILLIVLEIMNIVVTTFFYLSFEIPLISRLGQWGLLALGILLLYYGYGSIKQKRIPVRPPRQELSREVVSPDSNRGTDLGRHEPPRVEQGTIHTAGHNEVQFGEGTDYILKKALVSIPVTIFVIVLFDMLLPPVPKYVEQTLFLWLPIAWWGYLLVVIPMHWVGLSWGTKEAGFGTSLGAVCLSSFPYILGCLYIIRSGPYSMADSVAVLLWAGGGTFFLSSAIFALSFKATFARGLGLAVIHLILSLLLVGVSVVLFLTSINVSFTLQTGSRKAAFVGSYLFLSGQPTALQWLVVPTLVVSLLIAFFARATKHPAGLGIIHFLIANVSALAWSVVTVLVRPELTSFHDIEDVIAFLINMAVVGNLLSLCAIFGRRVLRLS